MEPPAAAKEAERVDLLGQSNRVRDVREELHDVPDAHTALSSEVQALLFGHSNLRQLADAGECRDVAKRRDYYVEGDERRGGAVAFDRVSRPGAAQKPLEKEGEVWESKTWPAARGTMIRMSRNDS